MLNRDQNFESGSGISRDIEDGELDERLVTEMVEEEERAYREVKTEIESEKDEKIKFRKAKRWTTFICATLAAISSFAGRPQEAEAQEMEMTYIENPVETSSDVKRLENLGMVEMVEESHDKLGKLKEAFGDDIEFINWSLYTRINQRLKELEDYVTGKRPVPDNKRLKGLKEGWTTRNEGTISELKEKSIEVEGFEDFNQINEDSDLNNSEIRDLIEDSYSESWLASVKDVAFVPEAQIIRMTTQGDTVTFAKLGNSLSVKTRAQIERNSPRDSVTIFPLPKHEDMATDEFLEKYVSPLLDHETAHSNDWENSVVLSPEERLNFLFETLEHYKMEDRFTNPHLESAEKAIEVERRAIAERVSDIDLGPHAYMAVREYWANLVMAYMQKPDILEDQHPEEYEFAEKWINKINSK